MQQIIKLCILFKIVVENVEIVIIIDVISIIIPVHN